MRCCARWCEPRRGRPAVGEGSTATFPPMVLAELEVWHSRPDHSHPARRPRPPHPPRRSGTRIRRIVAGRRRGDAPARSRRGVGAGPLPPGPRGRAGSAGGAAPVASPLPGRSPRAGPQHPPAHRGGGGHQLPASRTTARPCSRSWARSTPPSGWRRMPATSSPPCCIGHCAGTARPALRSSPTWPGARAGVVAVGVHRSRWPGRSKCSAFPPTPSARSKREVLEPVPVTADGSPPRPRRGRDQPPARRSSTWPRPAGSCCADGSPTKRRAAGRVGALLLAPGAGSRRPAAVARRDRGRGGTAAGRADGLPVSAGGPQGARPAAGAASAAVREAAAALSRPGRHRRPPAGAGRALDGWAHVLDGRGRRPARRPRSS